MACQWFDICPLRRFEREGLLDDTWARRYCRTHSNWKDCQRYQLEREGIPHPDNLLPDGTLDPTLA